MRRINGVWLVMLLCSATTLSAETLTGEVVWGQQVILRAPLSGRIDELVKVGATVQSGQSVCRLDNRREQAGLAHVESQWRYQQQATEEANKQWQQAQALYERMVLSDNALEAARTTQRKAQADLEKLRADKVNWQVLSEWRTLQSPWAAYVLEQWVTAGQTVVAGEPLLRLASVEKRVNILTDYKRWSALLRGQKVVVVVGHKRYDGQILSHFLEKTPNQQYRLQAGFDCASSCHLPVGLPVLVEINNHD
jgi:biotin carboxyl carrier protein